MTPPSVYDHVRPADADADYPDGVYRVVGVRETTVTLLRVADADARRVNTGELVAVERGEFAAFAPAENPDGNRSLRTAAASASGTVYWAGRVFAGRLAARPLPTAVATGLVAVGAFGEGVVSLPAVVLDGAILAGSLGLAYVGGRP